MGRIFGTDGARGVAITELSVELAVDIGRAAAVTLLKHLRSSDDNAAKTSKKSTRRLKILIGKDTRISGDILESALAAGIASVGVDAYIIGTVPTPAVAYLVTKYHAEAGVMISASHNPALYNGIKLFSGDGFKLPDEIETEIEDFILDRRDDLIKEQKSGDDVGLIVPYAQNALSDYIHHLVSVGRETDEVQVYGAGALKPLDGLSVVLDCANGSAAVTAEKIFSQLGAECVIAGGIPNGKNINLDRGSTHIDYLSKITTGLCADVGIAFDGDADRCLAVDETGAVVDGDKIIALLSVYLKERGLLAKDTAVATVMSNMGFHSYMRKNGINTVCTKVGDRYVLEEMVKNGYTLGGEQSGHIIMLDHSTTGDGQLTAVKLLALINQNRRAGKPFSQLVKDIPDFPQRLVNLTITADKKGRWETIPELTALIKRAEHALGENGRVLIRESGTEPLLRIMAEGETTDVVNEWTDRIYEFAKALLT